MTLDESVRRYGGVFDLDAEAYDAFRQGYPESIVDVAVERGNLRAGSRVLEVGPGTGKLTVLLAAKGLRIDAVDPGANMIEVARKRLGPEASVSFHHGRFEDVDLPAETFDAVFSATAFHWVDPDVAWAKAAAMLKGGGLLALLSHLNVADEQSKPLDDGFLALLQKHAPQVAADWTQPAELDAVLAGVDERRGNASAVWNWLLQGGLSRGQTVPEAASLFEDVEVAAEAYTLEESADELLAHFRTTSLFHMIEADRRDAFERDARQQVERLGGRIRSTLAVVLMTARRSERA